MGPKKSNRDLVLGPVSELNMIGFGSTCVPQVIAIVEG